LDLDSLTVIQIFPATLAFVYFESEIQLEYAKERTGLGFNGRQLYWSDREDSNKLCFHCGNPSHKLQDCTNRKPRQAKKVAPDAWQQAYNRFQPAGFKRPTARSRSRAKSSSRKPGISYADRLKGK